MHSTPASNLNLHNPRTLSADGLRAELVLVVTQTQTTTLKLKTGPLRAPRLRQDLPPPAFFREAILMMELPKRHATSESLYGQPARTHFHPLRLMPSTSESSPGPSRSESQSPSALRVGRGSG